MALQRARDLLLATTMFALTDDLLEVAGRMEPPVLRSLDAIHLAAAAQCGADLEAIVTYDERMIAAAAYLGLPVAHPGVRIG